MSYIIDTLYGINCSRCREYNVVNNGDVNDWSAIDVSGIKCCKCGYQNMFDEEDQGEGDDGNILLRGKTIFLIERDSDGYHGGGFVGFCLTEGEAKQRIQELEEEAKNSPCSCCGYVHAYTFYKVDKI